MTCPVYLLSNGTEVLFAPLAIGSCSAPNGFSFVVKTSATKGATSLEITATTTTASTAISIPANTWITVTTAAGLAVPVYVTATASGTTDGTSPFTVDLTLTVTALYAALAATTSTGEFPEAFTGRAEVSIDSTASTIEIVNFETAFYNPKAATAGSWKVDAKGQFQPTAAWMNAFYCHKNGRKGYLIVQLPNTDATLYSVGPKFEGEVSVSGMPVGIPAKDLVTGDITLEGAGDLVFTAPIAA